MRCHNHFARTTTLRAVVLLAVGLTRQNLRFAHPSVPLGPIIPLHPQGTGGVPPDTPALIIFDGPLPFLRNDVSPYSPPRDICPSGWPRAATGCRISPTVPLRRYAATIERKQASGKMTNYPDGKWKNSLVSGKTAENPDASYFGGRRPTKPLSRGEGFGVRVTCV